jgi:AbrB family looped-hinge helix DNA binding protein
MWKGGMGMPFVKVLRSGQITVPKEVRKVLGIKEGDVLEVALEKSGVVLKPKSLIDKASIFSQKGEKKIRKALQAYNKGETKAFDNVDELIRDLNS